MSMATKKTIDDINLLGGHPALDFVNTVDSRGERWGPDFLNNFSDLLTWASRVGLIDEAELSDLAKRARRSPSTADESLEEARELRETLYRLFIAESAERPVELSDLMSVTQWAQKARHDQVLTATEGRIEWKQHPAENMNAVAARIALSAADLLTSRPQRREVRACEGQNCGWLFLDQSKNGHRRWCSDKTCGSHARVRRFRARGS